MIGALGWICGTIAFIASIIGGLILYFFHRLTKM